MTKPLFGSLAGLGRLCLLPIVAISFVIGMANIPASAKEYLLTGAKPDKLFLIDMKERKIVRQYKIPYNSVSPMTLVPSPDNKIVYIVTNHNKGVTGINLETGKEVFRADMSHTGDERAINYALEVSKDGKELYSYELPTRLLPDRYQVESPRISVYDTSAGLKAKPVREFNDVPRRIHALMMKDDGTKLYALGWDFYTLDPKTGKIIDTFPLNHWDRPNASKPDLLNFWQLWDQADMFSSLISWMRTDLPPDDPKAYKTGLLTLDLKSGKFDVSAYDIKPEVLFTSVIGTDRKTAFAAFLNLIKIDLESGKTVKSVPLDHSYYITQVSGDGTEVYVGGTLCDIAIYSTKDLSRKGTVKLPGCPAMAGSSIRMLHW